MLFNSAPFLFLFLPLTWLLHVACSRWFPARALQLLLVASLVFYAAWDASYLPVLLLSLLGNFAIGRWLARARRWGRLCLGLGVAANLAALGYFKYANFAVRVVNEATEWSLQWREVVLPIGISFFTFQQIAYLVDSHTGQAKEASFERYALFISFFPQLIAGPIVHHAELTPQLGRPRESRLKDLSEGLSLLTIGLLKKLMLADSLAAGANAVFGAAAAGHAPNAAEAWLGATAYSLQIYFDFSAYSDMAIGLGRMFGIDLPINFASPYKARSIVDFWRRWHITLSRFLRDYLYIPLGGNRKGAVRQKLNLLLTMALGGIWHGANWTFLLWGVLHGVYLLINHQWRMTRWGRLTESTAAGRRLAHGLTLLAVVLAWVPFRAADLATTRRVWAGMLGLQGGVPDSLPKVFSAGLLCLLLGGVVMVLRAPNAYEIMAAARLGVATPGYPAVVGMPSRPFWSWRPSLAVSLLVGAAFAAVVLQLNDASEFIYFQF